MNTSIAAKAVSGFTFNDIDRVVYTVGFLVPGFLIELTLSKFLYQKFEEVPVLLLRSLTFSCLNYVLWIFIYLAFDTSFIFSHPIYKALTFIFIIFISPILVGLFVGYISQKKLLDKGLQSLGFRTVIDCPSAWDFKFSKVEEPLWVLVTLKDGSQVAGRFGTKSFASSESSERDLYLEEIYRISENSPWQSVPRTSGIWIQGSEISFIEFWNDEEEK